MRRTLRTTHACVVQLSLLGRLDRAINSRLPYDTLVFLEITIIEVGFNMHDAQHTESTTLGTSGWVRHTSDDDIL
jgi:hypothetical protein